MQIINKNSKKSLRIVFAVRSFRHFPQFRKMVRVLAQRGHTVHVLIYRGLTQESIEEIRRLEGSRPNVMYDWACPSERGGTFVFHSRELLSYRKHLLVSEHASFYAERWRKYLHPKLYTLFGYAWARMLLKTRIAGFFLGLFERLTPPKAEIVEHIRSLKPDAVIASPVNLRFSSPELEYLKAAIQAGIPTLLPMASWDNITSKGLYHVIPDRFLVWNDVQIKEMKEHHGVDHERVRVIGATTLDQWFPPPQATSREVFCKTYGFDAARPILAYFGSSINTAGDESWLVHEVRKIIDSSVDPKMRELQLLVRPHPKNFKIYDNINLPRTVVVPKGGYLPDPNKELQLFYDSLHHSIGVIGINTSVMLDTMVLDKPVISVNIGERATMQMETYHFPELVKARAIDLAQGNQEIHRAIQDVLNGNDICRENRRQFIARYIRPRGLKVSSGEAIADELEDLVFSKEIYAKR